jgi:RimJ/RimL family protein N-acetyltransferase
MAERVFKPLADERLWRFFPHLRPADASVLRDRFARWERGPANDSPTDRLWENWVAFDRSQTTIGLFQATIRRDDSALVAYSVVPSHWRQGFAREGILEIIRHLRDAHGVREICAEIEAGNAASIALVESLGFSLVRAGEDEVVYSLPPAI